MSRNFVYGLRNRYFALQKVPFCTPKPMLLSNKTYPFAVQKHTFRKPLCTRRFRAITTSKLLSKFFNRQKHRNIFSSPPCIIPLYHCTIIPLYHCTICVLSFGMCAVYVVIYYIYNIYILYINI